MSARGAAGAKERRARALAAAALAAAVALSLPASAAAHAVLTHSTPHRGATVSEAPPAVVFDFNEPVAVSAGALRVYDEDGERVDGTEIVRPGGSPKSVGVEVGDLGRGLYTATFRVVSADGHPVSGGFTFGVGVAVAKGGRAPDVAELLADAEAGPAVEGAYGVARAVHFAALLLLVGAVVFAVAVWPRDVPRDVPHAAPAGAARLEGAAARAGAAVPDGAPGGPPRWPRRLLVAAAAAGLVAALLGLLLQGALAAGVSLTGALDRDVLDASLDTRTGDAWAVRAALWLVVLPVVAAMRRPAFAPAAALMALAAALVVSLPLAGHADTQDPRAVLLPADVVHVAAAAAWLGGLVVLLAAFWRRTDSAGATEATARFSKLALWCVVAIATAGAVQAWFHLDGPESIVDSTYGLSLAAKLVLFAAIVAVAAGNRRRVGALLAGGTPGGLRRAMRAEVALALGVLAATAVLVRAEPPSAAAKGPATSELDLGPMRLEMVIEPATTGPNDFHLYFFDRRTGAQIDRVKEVTVRLTQPERRIGPIALKIPRKGPAHYELLDEALGVPGRWEIAVDARVSEFDQHTARDTMEVRSP